MPRTALKISALSMAQLGIDRGSEASLQRQLFGQIQKAILGGRIRPGSRLPSTRGLARELGISRNTVLSVFEQLRAEGYLQAKRGSGSCVPDVLPEDLLLVRPVPARSPVSARAPRISRRAHFAKTNWKPTIGRGVWAPFAPELTAIDQFPTEIWARLSARRWRSVRSKELGYNELAGHGPLREAISSYLFESRGIRCDARHVMIVSGFQQGLDLVCRVLLNPGDSVWIEDPSYNGTRAAFLAAGAKLFPIGVDDEGLNVGKAIQRARHARLAYVTPSHQYPLGMAMSLRRRLELLTWAAKNDAWILEDDYDGEFRYSGAPLMPLRALDQGTGVIYLSTFSRVLIPSLRLGYLVLPPDLVDSFLAVRALSDDCPPLHSQSVAAEFMAEGHFSKHLRRMRSIYAIRRQAMLEGAKRELEGLLELQPDETGLQLLGWLAPGIGEQDAFRTAAQFGIDVRPLSGCWFKRRPRAGLMLGFAGFTPHQIQTGLKRLGDALRSAKILGEQEGTG